MKTNFYTNGQSLVGIIIVFVMVGLISGGLYYYLSKQIPEVPEITEKPIEEKVIPEEAPPEEVKPEVTCQNECSSFHLTKCVGKDFQVCGYYDEDNCLDWGPVVSCPTNTVCQNGNCVRVVTPSPTPPTTLIIEKCTDGTPYGQCSTNKPKYCDNGNLIDKCSSCSCPSGQECQINEGCSVIPKGSIAIFIDTKTYNQLSNEVNRYKSDIQNDLESSVFLHYSEWQSADQIRNIILEHYQKDNLFGTVLIGNIPPGTDGDKSSDLYYQDLDNDLPLKEIWSGRIKPPVGDQAGIKLLKNYFDRNHNFRRGLLKFPKKVLIFNSVNINDDGESQLDIDYRKEKFAENSFRYTSNEVESIYNLDPGKQKTAFLEKLEKEEYELISQNIHGAPTSQGIKKGVWISFEEIKNVAPSAIYYELLSCNNGAFMKDDYLAGWALFSGKTLAVIGNTAPVFILDAKEDSGSKFIPLLSGALLGEFFLHESQNEVTHLFGDPTLRIVSPIYDDGPKMELSTADYDFGIINSLEYKEKIIGKIKVMNRGNKTLFIKYRSMNEPRLENKTLFGWQFTPIFEGKNNVTTYTEFINIEPGGERELSIKYVPTEVTKGKISQDFYFMTNDPFNHYIDLEISAEIK